MERRERKGIERIKKLNGKRIVKEMCVYIFYSIFSKQVSRTRAYFQFYNTFTTLVDWYISRMISTGTMDPRYWIVGLRVAIV